MKDLYGLESSGLPPELIARLTGVSREQLLADALTKQSLEPVQNMGGPGAKLSWTQGLDKVLKAYLGRKGAEGATAERGAIEADAERGRSAALDAYLAQKRGLPGVLPNDDEGNPMPNRADPRGAIENAQRSPYLRLSPFIAGERQELGRNEDREDKQAQRKQDLQMAAEQEIRKIQEQAAQGRITKAEADARHAELVKWTKANGGGGGAQPFFQAVSTPEGVMSFNARTGKMEPASATGVMKAADDPALQARIASGKAEGKAGGESNMAQFEVAKQAEVNLPKIDRLINHLQSSDAITGMGAEVLKGIERAKVLVTGSLAAGKKVSDTEIADVLMGAEVFPLIKELGIGARGMDTPAEREFMRNVLTGTTALNKDTLLRMAQMRRDAASQAIERYNERVGKGELDDFYRNTGRTKALLGAAGQKAKGVRRYNPATGQLE